MSSTSTPETSSGTTDYAVTYTTTGRESLSALEPTERRQAVRKLDRIRTCPFREPWEWDFERIAGVCDGRLALADGLRAFVDIDRRTRDLLVYRVVRRENRY